MTQNFLENLDGYQLEVLIQPLKKIVAENPNKFAFHCASIQDKKIIESNFSNEEKIFCAEVFFLKNFSHVNSSDFEKVKKETSLTITEIDNSFQVYSQFYFQAFLPSHKKKEISLKRAILNFKFYEKIFSEFKPDIVLHEHAGGTGSKILWNFCKRHNCKYYFFKGLYFSNKFTLLDHKDFTSPFFNIENIKNYPIEQIENFKKEFKNKVSLAPFEIHSKKINKVNFMNSLKSLAKKIVIYYKNNSEMNYLFNRFPPIVDGVILKLVSKVRKIIFSNFIVNKISLNKEFVVFFLQVEPELTSYALHNQKINIFKLLNRLSDLLPENFEIYVKEHPSQHINSRFRPLSFFDKLKKISKVKICPINYSSVELIKNSKFVLTGGGTAAFECVLYKKPCIIFAENFYFGYKGILRIESEDDLEDKIKIINDDINFSKYFENNNDENINFALNIKNSMLEGHLFLANSNKNKNEILKNNESIYNSLNKIINKIS